MIQRLKEWKPSQPVTPTNKRMFDAMQPPEAAMDEVGADFMCPTADIAVEMFSALNSPEPTAAVEFVEAEDGLAGRDANEAEEEKDPMHQELSKKTIAQLRPLLQERCA
jgi:hypothetical protein